MRAAPQKIPERTERLQRKQTRQQEARELAIQTIDQMHYRNRVLPDLKCGDCKWFRSRTCAQFYGGKWTPRSKMPKWSAKYTACGLFAKEGESDLRTKTRQATARPIGDEPVPIPRQKGLFL